MLNDGLTFKKSVDSLPQDWADALKEALIRRANGTLDWRGDMLLGKCLMNVARCAVCEMKLEGKLQFETRHDVEFDPNCAMWAVEVSNKVDVGKTGKEIFCYIRTGVKNRIKNYIAMKSRAKRRGDEVSLEDCDKITDIFGNT